MKCPRLRTLALLATALLTVASVVWLGWYNWNIRNTWVRLYPVCRSLGTYVDMAEPLTPLANELFVTWSTSTRPHHPPEFAARTESYIRTKDGKVYSRLWHQTLAGMENRQLILYMSRELATMLGKEDPDYWSHCSKFVEIATVSRRQDYLYRTRLNETAETIWTFLSFGVDRERYGEYSWVGRLLQPFAIEPILIDDEGPAPP